MIKVAPSIFAADFANLERDIRRTDTADYIHVDVMDGTFVPNFSIGIPVVEAMHRVAAVPLDVHLMIERPIRYVEAFAAAGADIITLHVEADTRENTLAALRKIHACGKKAGVVIKPCSSAQDILPFLPEADMVLVMTIEPGFGGQSFMADRIAVISEVRALIARCNPACELEVDGGITEKTAPAAVAAGANVLVAGSFLFQSPDVPAQIRKLRQSCAVET